MTQHLLITLGLPGSGKTTEALKLMEADPGKYKRVNRDSLRAMIDNSRHTNAMEKMIVKARNMLIRYFLADGYSVIVDDTNLNPRTVRELQGLANEAKVPMHTLDMRHIPLETCIRQDLARLNSVGEAVIRKFHNDYLRPMPPVIEYDPALPAAIMCDLDGTLCLTNGRNPYDASTCENDLPNHAVLAVLAAFDESHVIIYTSGRSDKYMDQTLRWMETYGAPSGGLFMRAEGDVRKDSVVKKEMFENVVRGNYNVTFVLDDRNQVVDAWRELGLTVFQVAEGNF